MQERVKYKEEIIKELQNMPDEQMLNLLSLIRIFRKSLIMQRDSDFYLKKEFDDWDALSNEELNNFEATL